MNNDTEFNRVKKLWRAFDPIGVYQLNSEWHENEYDAYVVPTYDLLKQNASTMELKAYVSSFVTEQMGLDTDQEKIDLFVKNLRKIDLKNEVNRKQL